MSSHRSIFDDDRDHHHRHSHTFELIFLIVEVALILLINTAFLLALYARRAAIAWKSTVFVANVAVSDLLCSFSLLVTAANLLDDDARSTTTRKVREHTLEYVIQLVTTYSIGITVLNYTALFLVQYFSIQKPLAYRTRCTRCIFVQIIAGQWLFVSGYVALKAVMITHETAQLRFSIAELILMASTTLLNMVAYGYVLYISYKRSSSRHSRRNPTITSDTSGMSRNPTINSGSRREQPPTATTAPAPNMKSKSSNCAVMCHIWRREYRNTVTAGFHCFVYLITFVPAWVVRVIVVMNGCPDSEHYDDGKLDRTGIYSCGWAACRVTMYIWYLRAIIDPVLQLIRDQRLMEESKSWLVRIAGGFLRRRRPDSAAGAAGGAPEGEGANVTEDDVPGGVVNRTTNL